MALVELKTKLNQFRGKDGVNNPYEKGKSVETLLESNVDINTSPERKNLSDTVDGEGRQILGQSISTQASTFLKGIKQFGIGGEIGAFASSIENNYENSIKRDAIFYGGNTVVNQLNKANQTFQSVKKSVKGFSDNPLKSIKNLANIDQEAKLIEYRSKAYGKFKNYGSQGSSVIGTDRKVAEVFEGPIKGGTKSSNVNKTNMIAYGDYNNEDDLQKQEGLIPFRFKDVLNNKILSFDAILSGITDTIAPEYSSERYIGRPESVYVYQGVQRSVGFTFDVYPMTRQELPVIWEKLNYLVGLCYPNWVDSPYAGSEQTNAITMVSPICELTIGDVYNNTPGYLSGLTMTIQDGTTWEYEENLQLPHYIQVAVEFVYIGKYLPNSKGKHFELNWLSDNSGDGSGTFPVKGGQSVVGVSPDRSPGQADGGYEWINPDNRQDRRGIFGDNVSRFKSFVGLDD